MFRRRLVLNAADAGSPGGAAGEKKPDPKTEERPVPPPAPKRAEQEPPPALAADALSEVSRRVSKIEKTPVVQIGAGAIFALALVAGVLILGVFFIVSRIARGRSEATNGTQGK